MCGSDSNLPPMPESKDLVAIIHPILMPVTAMSTREEDTISNTASSPSLSGRLRFSNRCPDVTVSEFSPDAVDEQATSDAYRSLHVRIHRYGRLLSTSSICSSSPSSVSVSVSVSDFDSASGSDSESDALDTEDFNPVIHSFLFSIDASSPDDKPNSRRYSSGTRRQRKSTGVNTVGRLDLGVGGDGILGRTVSITDGRRRLLGQGIIGRA